MTNNLKIGLQVSTLKYQSEDIDFEVILNPFYNASFYKSESYWKPLVLKI